MASSIDVSPTIGHAVVPTQLGVGSDPGYDAIDLRRMAQVGNREGVHAVGAWVVGEHTPNNMSINVAANVDLATVEGDSVVGQGRYVVAPHGGVANLTFDPADPALPRIDQIVLQVYDDTHDGSGLSKATMRVLTGTATAGADRTNRSGALALPATTLLLADVLVAQGVASISNSNITDRRDSAITTEQPGDVIFSAAASRIGCVAGNGAALSRTTYAKLFAAIGTTHGAGDGSTTFNVPDFSGRTAVGAGTGAGLSARSNGQKIGEETHQLSSGELPTHTHGYSGSTGTESADHEHPLLGTISAETADSLTRHVPVGGVGEAWTGVFVDANGGGTQARVPIVANINDSNLSHDHAMSGNSGGRSPAHTHGFSGSTDGGVVGAGAHLNIQPSTVTNCFIKF